MQKGELENGSVHTGQLPSYAEWDSWEIRKSLYYAMDGSEPAGIRTQDTRIKSYMMLVLFYAVTYNSRTIRPPATGYLVPAVLPDVI